ncbi:hypothetical protein, partial [Serratia marcescens]|uniref:hypothetical protein n=1 Tax=Serratia marcescens TaxID=615 RepID=UPI002380B7AB
INGEIGKVSGRLTADASSFVLWASTRCRAAPHSAVIFSLGRGIGRCLSPPLALKRRFSRWRNMKSKTKLRFIL